MDISSYKAKEFENSPILTPDTIPKGKLTIIDAKEIEIKKGVSAGEKKLLLSLEGEDKKAYGYFPNKTSVSTIAERLGDDTEKWKGKAIELQIESVRVNGQKMKAIFVK